ncbi:nicotinic acetylcholine receptor subunit type G [Loa loa]|uniref:Nicotinic acetylcholine receptor subunit type G n=1 Tax=Loa loa TaxID=7209 RepID=A0A1S0UE43_LOALO|nr:nicotinic acetylcholine receptor subunit type G [Loa loa]EJD73859.1 nicotinic acetylcholine receptor subunit type G [Loa loa]
MNDEQRLFKHIIRNYDTSVRPVWNASTVVNVYMGLTLTHIFNIDERNQVLTVNVWVEQSWRDERIHWNPAEFGNISKLTVGKNAGDFSRGFVDTNLHILSNGDTQWAPPAKVFSICKLDVRYFPFDDQFCFLEFGSWIYDQSQLDVQIMERYDGKNPFTRDSYIENGEWEIVANRTRKVLRGRQTTFSTIVFELHLRRRVLYFIYNIIAPCFMLSILTMMQFLLPCESGEKITLGLTVLLAYSVFSFNIAENMPETSDVIPLIAIYLMGIMAISGLSVSLSVIVLNMRHSAERNCRPPYWLNFIAYRILGRLFGKKTPKIRQKMEYRRSRKDLMSEIIVI